MKNSARRRIDVNLDELDRVLDSARQAPLSDADYEKIKEALHAMAALLVQPRSTEKPVPYWSQKTLVRPQLSRTLTHHLRPDMGGIQPRPLQEHRELTSRTRT